MITLKAPSHLNSISINTGGSKSISNRMLMIKQVLNLPIEFENLSTSDDTALLIKALNQLTKTDFDVIDVHHAGSTMRFLTALLSIAQGEKTITGSERMKQRPIGELVKALTTLGANINYVEKNNYPPLTIKGKNLKGGKLEIDSSISSQFITALLLIAPSLEEGLELHLNNKAVSMPYIQMTIALLQQFGVSITQKNNSISVEPYTKKETKKQTYIIESDWSSASYWYSMVALSNDLEISLDYQLKESLQADAILPVLYKQLGVETFFNDNKITLKKIPVSATAFSYDFTNCPDIAQTIAVTCFGLGLKTKLTGLQTLKIKETDRILALKNELEKFDITCTTSESTLAFDAPNIPIKKGITIDTYNDHRMAMSFAPLCLKTNFICIENHEVVSKSYPLFWKDVERTGITIA